MYCCPGMLIVIKKLILVDLILLFHAQLNGELALDVEYITLLLLIVE